MGVELLTRPPTLDVWIIILGETVTRENFELCSQAVDKSFVPKNSYLKGDTAWRYIVGCLLPQFTMRQRHVPRKEWSFAKTKVVEGPGKPYLSLTYDPGDSNNKRPAMGFTWAETGAAMAFAHSLGPKEIVVNIGVGICTTQPMVSASAYLQSHLHMLTRKEEQSISIEKYGDERSIRRLNIILTMKDAYLRAMGQPVGFDHSRICCDVGKNTVKVDGQSIDGWEFHIFTANVDSHKKIEIAPHLHQYLVVVAVFRGGKDTRFIFTQEKDMGFVKFFDVSQIIRDVPRLGDYDNHNVMPPVEHIPLSTKSSVQTLTPHHKSKRSTDAKFPPPSSDVKHAHPHPLSSQYSNSDVKHPFEPTADAYPVSYPQKQPSSDTKTRTVPIHIQSNDPYVTSR